MPVGGDGRERPGPVDAPVPVRGDGPERPGPVRPAGAAVHRSPCGGPQAAVDARAVAARVQVLRRRLEASGAPPDLRIVAVTKGFGADAVAAALGAGIVDVGENYPSELFDKARSSFAVVPRWHFLGAIQRRHVRRIAPLVALWHSVCRVQEGEAIAACVPDAEVLVQVELTGRSGRRGVEPSAVGPLLDGLRRCGVVPVGLMTLGVAGDRALTDQVFRATADLARRVGVAQVSMGMSDDVELAVAAGATIVRVGRALFGERPPKFPREALPPQ